MTIPLLAYPPSSHAIRPPLHAIRLAARYSRRAVRALVIECANRMARPNDRPIFILGNQKSGTSAICGLLGMSTGLSVSPDLWREEGGAFYLRIVRGELPFRALIARNRRDFSRDIVKEPNLTLFHRELRAHFPAARYVMIVRDPRDNIRSLLNRLDVPGNLTTLDTGNGYHLTPGQRMLLDDWPGITPRAHYIARLAERWNACADVYLQDGAGMVLQRYEDFSRDKEASIHRLAEALGLTPRYDIRDKLDVQFQPRGNRSVSWKDFFGDENLAQVERICGSRMTTFGYA